MTRGAALITVLACCAGCERVAVQGGLDERAANEIALLLDESGVASEKAAEPGASSGARTYAVMVGASDTGRAFQVLSDHALPRPAPAGFDEVLRDQSLIPSSAEERARHTQALAGELARTFESVRGVLEARVHLALPEPALLDAGDAPPVPATASVLLKVAGIDSPIPLEDARRLVAGAVAGLQPQAVTVVLVRQPAPARPLSDGLVSIAGVRVSPSSAGAARGMLGATLGLNVLLAAGLVVVTLRRRVKERQHSKEPA